MNGICFLKHRMLNACALSLATVLFVSPSALAGDGDGVKVGYKNGFYIEDANRASKLVIQGRVQARYTHEALGGFNTAPDDESAFAIQRARLTLKGNVFSENLKYKFQSDFGKGKVSLRDFFVDYRLVKDWLHVRAGQWKKPFSRQQINSSSKLEFVDRPATNEAFDAGRDVGLAFHNNYEKSPDFEYALGLYNGNGISEGPPERFNPTLVLRLGYNYGGIKGYSEADLEGGPFRFAIGGSVMIHFDVDEDKEDEASLYGEVDFAIKVHGFALNGGFYVKSADDDTLKHEMAGQLDAHGFHVQAGYLIADKYQPSVRLTRIHRANDTEKDDDDVTEQEIAVGMSVYFIKHNLKWQTDVALINTDNPGDENDSDDVRIRTQLQLSF